MRTVSVQSRAPGLEPRRAAEPPGRAETHLQETGTAAALARGRAVGGGGAGRAGPPAPLQRPLPETQPGSAREHGGHPRSWLLPVPQRPLVSGTAERGRGRCPAAPL